MESVQAGRASVAGWCLGRRSLGLWACLPETGQSSAAGGPVVADGSGIGPGGFSAPVIMAWLVVSLPILWGVWITLSKAFILFR